MTEYTVQLHNYLSLWIEYMTVLFIMQSYAFASNTTSVMLSTVPLRYTHAALSESVIPDTGALSWQSSARVLVSIQEVLGRLLGMLFQWFDATAYLPDGTYVTLIVVLQSLISDQRMAHIYFYFKSY